MSLTEHLASGAATTAYCWVVARKDGVTIGVTDHDEDVVVEGVTCSSATGMVTTKFEQSLGLVEDDLEIEGVIDDDQITVADMRAGKFDDADVKLYLVNWQDPTEFFLFPVGKFGKITEGDGGAFRVEFLSRSHDLQQPVGRTFQRNCDTKLGEAPCGIDLTLPAYRTTTTVQTVVDSTVTVLSLSGYDNGWFTFGSINVDGQIIGIRRHDGLVLELRREPDVPIEVGASITVTAGCRQDAETCRLKFNNITNFQGFHFIPGNDRLTDYPVRGQDDYDGGSLFK